MGSYEAADNMRYNVTADLQKRLFATVMRHVDEGHISEPEGMQMLHMAAETSNPKPIWDMVEKWES